MNLQLRCPSCGSTNQFIQPINHEPVIPDDTPITCTCGATHTFGTLKAYLVESQATAITTEAERLASEAARRALGDLLK